MKKIMGHLKGKLSLSILSVIVLLVGLLAGFNGITSVNAGGKQPAATRASQNSVAAVTPSASQTQVASHRASSQASAASVAAKPDASPAAAAYASKDAAPAKLPTKDEALAAAGKLPLVFEPNKGQTDSQVKFFAHSLDYQVYMTGPASATLKFPEIRKHDKSPEDLQKLGKNRNPDVITMTLAGANNAVAPQLLDPTGGVSNYYLGNDPSKWLQGVPNYAKLRYDGVYPGIDVVYQGDNLRFRYDFQVNPGADPKAIRIAYDGGKGVRLDNDGNTVVDLSYGHLLASKPVIFQEFGGQRHMVDGRYVLSADNTLSFEVGAYDKSQTLIIDPQDSYATYIGPTGAPTKSGNPPTGVPGLPIAVNAVAIDASGVYFAGSTAALTFPSTCKSGSGTNFDTLTCAGTAAFVYKLNLNLSAVIGSTTFGGEVGSSAAVAYGIGVFNQAPVVVGGTNAGTNFPVKSSLETSPGDVNIHAFVVSLTSALAVNWSTLLSGTGTEAALAVALEQTTGLTGNHPGNIHITGYSNSGTQGGAQLGPSSFLSKLGSGILAGAYQPNQSSTAATANFLSGNAFYVVLNNGGTAATYGTLFGGWNEDAGFGVAVDGAGNGYVVGTSTSFGAGQVVGFENTAGNAGTAATEGTTATGAIGAPNLFTLATPVGTGCSEGGGPAIFPPPTPPFNYFGTPATGVTAQGTAIVTNTGNANNPNFQVTAIAVTNPGAGYAVTQNPLAVNTGCGTVFAYIGNFVSGGVSQSASGNNLPIPTATLSLTNPGSGYTSAPNLTFIGGSCVVEPTAVAILSNAGSGSLASLVLTSEGTGCVTAPQVLIAPPPLSGGVTGIPATATYTTGTTPILINPTPALGAVSATAPSGGLPNPHGFLAKFNPNNTGAAINSLDFATAIGNAGPGFTETDFAIAVATDLFGNAYVGGATDFTTIDPPAPYVVTNPIFGANNTIFTSPGMAGGELTSITVTNAGFGFGDTVTVDFNFTWGADPNDGCLINPHAHAKTDHTGSVIPNSVVITNSGLGCTIVPQVTVAGTGTQSGFTAIAALGSQMAGTPNATPANLTGWVFEMVAQTSLNNGLTTTSTQDGIPLGPNAPSSQAGWPAMIYFTEVGADEDCTSTATGCSLPLTGGFGNGSGTDANSWATYVTGVTVDTLGQTYVSGFATGANAEFGNNSDGFTPTAVNPAALLLRRRINANGWFTDPTPFGTPPSFTKATVGTNNSQFLADFPQVTGQDITPYGSVIIAGAPGFEGVLNGVAFDPTTDTACFGGWLDEPLPATTGSSGPSVGGTLTPPPTTTPTPFELFPQNLSLPLNFTVLSDAFGYPIGSVTTPNTGEFATISAANPGGWYGVAVCTVFQDDIVVHVNNPGTGETASSILFTMPTGTLCSQPGGPACNPQAPNNPNFPPAQTISGTVDGTLGVGGSVSLGTIQLTYYQGKTAEQTPGDGPDSSTASNILWLNANPQGSSVLLSLNPSTNSGAPGAPFLDPGIYYCLVTVTPTGLGFTADNGGIPQTIVVQLNVTGALFVNSTVGGGPMAAGSTTDGGTINLSLQAGSGGSQQAGLGTAQWTTPNQVLDQAGNLVLNIPVVSNVPFDSPSHGNFVFLVNQGTVSAPKPLNSSNAFPILNTGYNTSASVPVGTTPSVNPINNDVTGAGVIYLTPIDGLIELPGGVSAPVSDIQFIPPGTSACAPFSPPDTDDDLAKAGANYHQCMIQVIIPPTILQGAPTTGTYSATLELQSIPDLTDPASPVRNDHSRPYLDFVPIASTDGDAVPNPGVESFCVGTACTVSNLGAVTAGAATVGKIKLNIQLAAGPLIINSPWISNTITNCLMSPTPTFSTPVCNTNGIQIPLAPFEVPSGYQGVVTSNINSVNAGNNTANTYNNVVLDSRNLGTTAQGGYTVSMAAGLQAVGVGANPTPVSPTTVTPLQVANDYFIYQNLSSLYPIYDVPTCTLNSPAIPAGVLTVNGTALPAGGATLAFNNVLPASNSPQTTTAFTIGITNPSALANGFYASTLTVIPTCTGCTAAQGAEIPVCLEVGNNTNGVFEKITPPTTVPPTFDPSNLIVPSDGLILSNGQSQTMQLIVYTLGPNQAPQLLGQATFGTPSFVAIPVTIDPPTNNPMYFPLTSLPNIGNVWSFAGIGSISLDGGQDTAVNCSAIVGWVPPSGTPATGCFTDAYIDFVVTAPNLSGGTVNPGISFTVTDTGTGLLSGTVGDPAASAPITLPVIPTTGPTLVYTACTGNVFTGAGAGSPVGCVTPTAPNSPGVIAYITLIASNGFTGGVGYTTVPNVFFTGGCSTEPTAVATITSPGPNGQVSGIFMTSQGSGCTAAPVVVIDPPATATGVVAAAQAFISNTVLNFTFNLAPTAQPGTATSCLGTVPVGSASCTGPATDSIFVQSSQFGLEVLQPTSSLPLPTITYNPPATYLLPVGPPVTGDWLNIASINCQPNIIPNATPIAECEFSISLNPSASELPQGTYEAFVAYQDAGASQITPGVVASEVTLNITNLISVLSNAPQAGFTFTGFSGATAATSSTTPTSDTVSLSLNGFPTSTTGANSCAVNPAQAVCEVNSVVSVSQNNGPAGWLLINGGTSPVNVTLMGPGTGAVPATFTITINPASLAGLSNLPLTWNGVVTVTTPSSQVSNPVISIPVTVNVIQPSSLQFSPSTGFTTSYTIGQTNTAQPGNQFSTTLQQFGTTGTVNFTSSCGSPAVSPCPWLTLGTASSTLGLIPQTFTITPTLLTTPGPAVATVTASGPTSLTTTATITVNVMAPPTITFTTLNCGPASVTAGIASLTCTSNVALSSAPANPTTLPVTVTASTTGSTSNCTVSSTNPVTIAALGTTANPLSFTVTPSTGTGISNGSCIVALAGVSTGGITPPVTGSTSTTVTVGQAQLTVTPNPNPSIFNLPVGAAPATQMWTITANSPAGNIAVPFTCTPSVALPVSGNWLACTGGTTSSVSSPPPNSTVTATIGSLGAGAYGGAVTYSTTQLGVANPPTNTPVTLYVGALSVTGGPVTFNHQLGVTVPVAQALQVGGGLAMLNYTSSTSGDCAWLSQSAGSGTTPGANGTTMDSLSYTAAAAATAGVGQHICTITFMPAASYGAPASDNVVVTATLNVSTNPVIQATPGSQNVTVLVTPGTASTTTTFSVDVSSILAPATSITANITPVLNPLNTGTNPTPIFTAPATMTLTTSPSTLTVTANYGGLPVGTYQGSFAISSTAASNTATVVVNLVVSGGCSFAVSPVGPVNLTNVVPANGSTPVSVPGSFSMTPSGLCGSGNTWTVTSDASWLIVTSGGTGNGSAVDSGTFLALSNTTPSARSAHLNFTPSAGTPQVITVTQPGSTAAINLLEITALYQQILGRDPDPNGYTFWSGTGAAGLGQMADAFFTSPESFNTNFAVIAAYQATTGAPPTFAAFTTQTQGLAARYGSQTIGGLFTSLAPASLTAANMYQNLLNRAPSASETTACNAAGLAACFQTIIGYPANPNVTPVGPGSNNEFMSTGTFANHTASCTTGTCTVPGDHTNLLYIDMLYFTTLSRDPDAGGQQFWLGIANTGGAGILFQGSTELAVRIQIEGTGIQGQGFIGSPEFQSHF